MKIAFVLSFALAGCVVPAQQPTYFAQGGGPPTSPTTTSGGPPPPPAATTAAGASCQDTMVCYGQCNPLTDQCVNACDARTTPDSVQNAHALMQCMAQSGCQDQNCVAQRCGPQITTCTGMTMQTAQAGGSAPPPASGGDCEAVVNVQKDSYGTFAIPPTTCHLALADLTGEWDQGMGSATNYYDSSGNYTGGTSVSTASSWKIDARGGFTEHWVAATTNSNDYTAHGTSDDKVGTVTVEGNNTLTINLRADKYHQTAYAEHYIVVGWLPGPSEITMELQGPFDHPPTQQDFDNVRGQKLYDAYYHRKR